MVHGLGGEVTFWLAFADEDLQNDMNELFLGTSTVVFLLVLDVEAAVNDVKLALGASLAIGRTNDMMWNLKND